MPSHHLHPGDAAALILAGGPGSRLGIYTWNRAKPAVPAGNTVLASFSSSNAENSHIGKIVIASQHLPRSLRRFYNEIYGSDFGPGKRVDMTDPTEFERDAIRYKGTADAFRKAMIITGADKKKYILGLSGDHIYQMDFQKVFDDVSGYHQRPDFIIMSQEVLREEASRFGILFTDGTKVVDFKEKPKELPGKRKKYDANMGIYLASSDKWREILHKDSKKLTFREGDKDPSTQTHHDIGQDIIPELLRLGLNVHAYRFNGYWRDAGIPKALYDALLDIFIRQEPNIMGSGNWKISALYEPQFRSNGERYFTCGSFASQKSKLDGSVFSSGVDITGSEVLDSVLMGGSSRVTKVDEGAVIRRAMIDKEVTVGSGSKIIGSDSNLVMVAKGTVIPAGTSIEPNSDAIVSSLDEMVVHAANLIDFRRHVSPSLQLYTPEGRLVSFDELIQLAPKD